MKIKYTYVPPCPRCGSVHTGRYICQTVSNSTLLNAEQKALERGELVRITSIPYSELQANLYCSVCGIEWTGKTTQIWLTKKEIDQIKKREGITEEDFQKYKRHRKSSFAQLKDFISSVKESNLFRKRTSTVSDNCAVSDK